MRFYNDSLHLHGSTHDTKTNYKHISRCYLLDYPGQTQKAFIVALNRAIRIGQTNYPYIVMKIKEQYSPEIKINLEEEEIKKNYGDNLLKAVNDGVLQGPLYHNLASLFSSIVHSKVITTGDHFRSFDNDHCVKCSVKAQEGLLYPLVKSFLFIHKPVVNIKHQEIKEVKFLRIASKQRTFDLQVICKGQGNQFEFTGIKKDEYEPFSNYLAQSSIKVAKQQQQARKSNKKSYAPEDQYIDYDDGQDESDDQDYQEGGDDDQDDDDDDDDDDQYDGNSNSQSNSQDKRQMKKK